jgi:hypothetical protein
MLSASMLFDRTERIESVNDSNHNGFSSFTYHHCVDTALLYSKERKEERNETITLRREREEKEK